MKTKSNRTRWSYEMERKGLGKLWEAYGYNKSKLNIPAEQLNKNEPDVKNQSKKELEENSVSQSLEMPSENQNNETLGTTCIDKENIGMQQTDTPSHKKSSHILWNEDMLKKSANGKPLTSYIEEYLFKENTYHKKDAEKPYEKQTLELHTHEDNYQKNDTEVLTNVEAETELEAKASQEIVQIEENDCNLTPNSSESKEDSVCGNESNLDSKLAGNVDSPEIQDSDKSAFEVSPDISDLEFNDIFEPQSPDIDSELTENVDYSEIQDSDKLAFEVSPDILDLESNDIFETQNLDVEYTFNNMEFADSNTFDDVYINNPNSSKTEILFDYESMSYNDTPSFPAYEDMACIQTVECEISI